MKNWKRKNLLGECKPNICLETDNLNLVGEWEYEKYEILWKMI